MISRGVMRRLLFLVNKLIAQIQNVILPFRKHENPMHTVFILGAPRCGSTLVMQVFTDAFEFGYLSNKHCRWFGAPELVERWARKDRTKSPSDYTSLHGRTAQDTDPAECGAWWYRFFRREPAYVTNRDVSERGMRAFRQSIAALQALMERPLIFKNLYVGLRLEPIATYLPGALFVVIERNWVDTAGSILRGRKDALGRYDQWWSVPPPNVELLKQWPPVEQVVGQIESIHRLIEHDIERLELEGRVFRIEYEEFCADVHGTLSRFKDFMARQGVCLERRLDVPREFEVSHPADTPSELYEELVAYVAERRRVGAAGKEVKA